MQRNLKSTAAILLLAFMLSGCSSFSKSAREQRAYRKYVTRSSYARDKQRSRFKSDKPQMPVQPMPSEPTESSKSGPQSMPSEPSGQ